MRQTSRIGRREFLVLTGGAGAALLAGCGTGSSNDRSTATVAKKRATVGPGDPSVAARELERAGTGRVSAFDLTAAATTLAIGRRQVNTWAYGGQVPGQPLRVRQGDTMAVRLRNELPEATTIHWHGLAVRNDMDGVPDITQAVVGPGASFDYRFVVPDAGTYWFHPHMGLQLDRALYAPLIVEEKDDPGPYDLDQVVVLDDWLDGIDGNSPEKALKDLVAMGTGSMDMGDMTPMAKSSVLGGDAGDVTYPLHLMNGRPPEDPETFTVPAGGRARLRFINAGSDTAYRVAVGGHRMTVTHADGFPVAPVEVDTILIGMGERYDVTVEPLTGAWPLVALAEGKDATARAIIRTSDAVTSSAPPAAARPKELDGKRLRYSDLVATEEARLSTRRADLHQTLGLTGSMMGNSWGFDGKPFADHAPIEIEQGQRVRLTFENTTSMWHPIHLHGHSFRLGTNAAGARKDTVNVLPGESVTIDFDADNPGQWMTHCHNTYHLEQGMALLVSYVT